MSEQFDADLANAKQHARTVAQLDHIATAFEELVTEHNRLVIYAQRLESRLTKLENR